MDAPAELVGRRAFGNCWEPVVRWRICYMVTAERQRDVLVFVLTRCKTRAVRTCDKGSIGARRSCLREACRPGLGSLLWEELVFDGVLRSRPGDGRLDDEAVSGLTTGMVSSAQLDSCACMRQPLHCLEGTWQGKLPTWTRHEKPVWETGQDWAGSTRL
jgi:hypothetical protein